MMRATSLLLAAAAVLFAQNGEGTRAGLDAFHRGAYMDARRILGAAPASPEQRVFLALSEAATGGCAGAVPRLESLFESESAPDLRRLAGLGAVQCHLAAKRPEPAALLAAKLQGLFPADADVLYQAARVHMRAWNDTVALMFQKTPASFRVNQLSAEIFETQGRYAEAVQEYKKAIAKNPAALNLNYRLGRALLLEQHSPEALAQARQAFEAELKLNPADAVAEYQVAQILLAGAGKSEAAARYERALALQPDFAEAMVALGKLRSESKQYEQAIPLLERAVSLQPANEPARYALMLAYRNAGRAADAARQKDELDRLRKPPEGEFTDFLKRLGEKAAKP